MQNNSNVNTWLKKFDLWWHIKCIEKKTSLIEFWFYTGSWFSVNHRLELPSRFDIPLRGTIMNNSLYVIFVIFINSLSFEMKLDRWAKRDIYKCCNFKLGGKFCFRSILLCAEIKFTYTQTDARRTLHAVLMHLMRLWKILDLLRRISCVTIQIRLGLTSTGNMHRKRIDEEVALLVNCFSDRFSYRFLVPHEFPRVFCIQSQFFFFIPASFIFNSQTKTQCKSVPTFCFLKLNICAWTHTLVSSFCINRSLKMDDMEFADIYLRIENLGPRSLFLR